MIPPPPDPAPPYDTGGSKTNTQESEFTVKVADASKIAAAIKSIDIVCKP